MTRPYDIGYASGGPEVYVSPADLEPLPEPLPAPPPCRCCGAHQRTLYEHRMATRLVGWQVSVVRQYAERLELRNCACGSTNSARVSVLYVPRGDRSWSGPCDVCGNDLGTTDDAQAPCLCAECSAQSLVHFPLRLDEPGFARLPAVRVPTVTKEHAPVLVGDVLRAMQLTGSE